MTRIKFYEEYSPELENGLGSVEISNDDGTVTALVWDDSQEGDRVSFIPSPYNDVYGFVSSVLEAVGVEAEVEATYGE